MHPINSHPHSRSPSLLLQGASTASHSQPPPKNLTKIARDRVWQRGKGGGKEGARRSERGRDGGRPRLKLTKWLVAWMRLSAKSAVWARTPRRDDGQCLPGSSTQNTTARYYLVRIGDTPVELAPRRADCNVRRNAAHAPSPPESNV